MLKQAFKALQINVGLKGNIFVRDFSRLSNLAEDCWFKKMWELCHRFKVALIIHELDNIQRTRRRDKPLMECFIDCGAFNINELPILNRLCKYKETHSLSNILRCDGKTVHPEMILP